jgi:arginase family enzyme
MIRKPLAIIGAPSRAGAFAPGNVDAVLRKALDVEQKVRRAVSEGCRPFVIGGDCTVGLGTVAGHLPTADSIGLLYFDLHPDLNVPDVGERRDARADRD